MLSAQTPQDLLKTVKTKYDQVNDYQAKARLKTNVAFIRAPLATVSVFYKRPNKLRIKNDHGISFIPKGSVNINMSNILMLSSYDAIDGGRENVSGVSCRVIRIFPTDDHADITRATVYVDDKKILIMKSVVSTRENGTYEIVMNYGKYANWGLADKAVFTFNTRDYKLPKGVTIDYDNGTSQKDADKLKSKKGTVEIQYLDYTINKGIDDTIFK
jgi:outer membrane lipoprotein-sorting protein